MLMYLLITATDVFDCVQLTQTSFTDIFYIVNLKPNQNVNVRLPSILLHLSTLFFFLPCTSLIKLYFSSYLIYSLVYDTPKKNMICKTISCSSSRDVCISVYVCNISNISVQ